MAVEPSIDYFNVNLTGREKKGESLIALREEGIAPENIIQAIEYICEEHGSFENYFEWIGYTADEIAELKARFVEKE